MKTLKIGLVTIAVILIAIFALTTTRTLDQPGPLPSDSPDGSPSVDLPKAGDYSFKVGSGGKLRSYRVHVPRITGEASLLPVVLVLHGGGSNSEDVESNSQMNDTSDKEGFLTVYPEGTGRKVRGKLRATWNAVTCCGAAVEDDIDDVAFVSAIINKLTKDFPIDQNKIYSTGISNGGMMSYRLACELSDKIAAIAPVAGTFNFNEEIKCSPKRAVPIIHFHGREDTCALYEGGQCGGCFGALIGDGASDDTVSCKPAIQSPLQWVEINNLSAQKKTVLQNSQANCVAYGSKKPGEVQFCTIDNLGHRWPGASPYGTCEKNLTNLACKRSIEALGPFSSTLSANEVMWDFFERHSLTK